MTSVQEECTVGSGGEQERDKSHTNGSTSKFRFKSKRKDHGDRHGSRESSEPRAERKYRHHHRRKKRRHASADEPHSRDHDDVPRTSPEQSIDPDAAFRESLFDAMADDEGAQYWEGVYGQPIHNYSDVKQTPTGELERMTDDEYTAFVRSKMYEKTHQHLIEEKARRDAARKERAQRAKEGAKEEREAESFRRKVEESLKRGQERKSQKTWLEKWNAYVQKWEDLNGKNSAGSTNKVFIASIPWPVESGNRKDVSSKEIERFFLYAPTSGQPTEAELGKVLKLERVRWHPDKIQQKLGGQDVSEDIMQAVTEVFQVIDQMWADVRKS